MQVHNGQWRTVHEARQQTLDATYEAHPERFSRPPKAKKPPKEAWIGGAPKAKVEEKYGDNPDVNRPERSEVGIPQVG